LRNALVPIIVSLLQALLCLSCNEPFTPKGPFQEQLVVYSVLSNDRDLQFVRVYSSYDVPGYDPFANTAERSIVGAQVFVTGAGETRVFRDTLLPRADTSRYKTPIHAYVCNWRAQQGKTYDIHVVAGSQGSNASGLGVPARPAKLEMYGESKLDDPGDLKLPGTLNLAAQVQSTTKGFACQMLIEYSVSTPAGWNIEQIEVMSDIPTLTPVISKNQNNSFLFGRSKSSYVWTLNLVIDSHPGQHIVFKRVVFRLLQFEKNMYDYFSIVHGFQDPFTIRFDEPDYTNMSNGYGLFGAYSLDSLVHIYPDNFIFNR
jgi:hypothetical protein